MILKVFHNKHYFYKYKINFRFQSSKFSIRFNVSCKDIRFLSRHKTVWLQFNFQLHFAQHTQWIPIKNSERSATKYNSPNITIENDSRMFQRPSWAHLGADPCSNVSEGNVVTRFAQACATKIFVMQIWVFLAVCAKTAVPRHLPTSTMWFKSFDGQTILNPSSRIWRLSFDHHA